MRPNKYREVLSRQSGEGVAIQNRPENLIFYTIVTLAFKLATGHVVSNVLRCTGFVW